jgi:putative acetyltransferase
MIRPEEPSDREGIHSVEAAAFGTDIQADLVDDLRNDPGFRPGLSLVAIEDGRLVGHVILTEMRLGGQRRPDVLALGPIAASPERQGNGIGRGLVEESIRRADEEGAAMIVLVGDPDLYRRFGFRLAGEFGVSSPPYPDEYVQVRTLSAYDPEIRGEVAFAEPFDVAEAREGELSP